MPEAPKATAPTQLRLMVFWAMLAPEPSLFDGIDIDAEAAADADAEADYLAGRVISHEAMKAWISSWGTADELPPPRVGD